MAPTVTPPATGVEYGAPDSVHTGRVAAAWSRLSGLAVTTCQRMLGEPKNVELVATMIDAHIAAGDFTSLIHRIAPIERALARVPAEAYEHRMETDETAADGAEDLMQMVYVAEQSDENARRRIRANEAEIVQLQRVNRALALRHGFTL